VAARHAVARQIAARLIAESVEDRTAPRQVFPVVSRNSAVSAPTLTLRITLTALLAQAYSDDDGIMRLIAAR
jgi:hypothetical protein